VRLARLFAFGAAPARERPDAWPALMVHNVIRIAAGVQRSPLPREKIRQLKPRAKFDQDVLERAHISIGRQVRLAGRVGWTLGAADRPVEQRNAIPSFE
jgi:hypothetical protein